MLHDLARQVGIQQQIRQLRPRAKRRADVFQQRGADDAAAPPDPRHGFEIEVILVFVRSHRQKRQALRIGDDHRGIKRAAQLREERVAVAGEAPLGSLINRAGLLPFLREHGQVPHRDRQVNGRNRHLQLHRALWLSIRIRRIHILRRRIRTLRRRIRTLRRRRHTLRRRRHTLRRRRHTLRRRTPPLRPRTRPPRPPRPPLRRRRHTLRRRRHTLRRRRHTLRRRRHTRRRRLHTLRNRRRSPPPDTHL